MRRREHRRGEWEGGERAATLFVLIWRASLASFAATVTVKRPHSETEELKIPTVNVA